MYRTTHILKQREVLHPPCQREHFAEALPAHLFLKQGSRGGRKFSERAVVCSEI